MVFLDVNEAVAVRVLPHGGGGIAESGDFPRVGHGVVVGIRRIGNEANRRWDQANLLAVGGEGLGGVKHAVLLQEQAAGVRERLADAIHANRDFTMEIPMPVTIGCRLGVGAPCPNGAVGGHGIMGVTGGGNRNDGRQLRAPRGHGF